MANVLRQHPRLAWERHNFLRNDALWLRQTHLILVATWSRILSDTLIGYICELTFTAYNCLSCPLMWFNCSYFPCTCFSFHYFVSTWYINFFYVYYFVLRLFFVYCVVIRDRNMKGSLNYHSPAIEWKARMDFVSPPFLFAMQIHTDDINLFSFSYLTISIRDWCQITVTRFPTVAS